ncbi:MAG: exodeoxyribonuclease VII small subunit [Desulfobacteraceae bacterium]|jgi:exodeoxyribonuclease VII small subunit
MTKLTFEKAMEQLEKIVASLETEAMSLEQSLKKFEDGMKLTQYCSEKLEETEKKISLIMGIKDDDFEEVPFEDLDS